MTSPTHAPLVISVCCAAWRTKEQHSDCPGVVRATSQPGAPLLPCTCERCAERPNHRVRREQR